MCRWLAYSGPPIPLGALLTCPNHSLIDQSRRARENVATTNADGFGVGWYDENRRPGRFRDTHPAWNNENLRNLAQRVRSSMFLAHVRAATGTPVQNTNCHPFALENWLFQHNGSVPHFGKLKRRLMFDVEPDLFPHIQGSTDSEVLFFLTLTFGLRADPSAAMERMVGHVERLRKDLGVTQPLTLSAAISDGHRLFAVRYSSHGNSPTLYHSRHVHALRVIDRSYEPMPDGAVIVLSEPLDDLAEHWEAVPECSFVTVEFGETKITRFAPKPT